jgi:hypothetical protein
LLETASSATAALILASTSAASYNEIINITTYGDS